MTVQPRKILVVRNDRLGDFMLAYPALFLLREALPGAGIHALVPPYTREMAEACRAVDGVVIDPGRRGSSRQRREFTGRLRAGRYDAVLTLFSSFRIGWQVFRARIPYRLAPATKLAQLFYTHRLRQRRSRSVKPEWEYNVDLIRAFLAHLNAPVLPTPGGPYLEFPPETVAARRGEFCRSHAVDPQDRLVFVHPGSGGSASNLSPGQFGELARRLHDHAPHTTVITAGPGEDAVARQVAASLSGLPHVIYRSTRGLRRFAEHIAFADVFVSGSTGPLHVAGALDRPTAGFYPLLRSSTALRWQTLNGPGRRLAFSPHEAEDGSMEGIDLAAAARTIGRAFLLR